MGSTAAGPVHNGTIVLVRKGNTVGAMIPRYKSAKLTYRGADGALESDTFGSLHYTWFYRSDGNGTFRRAESSAFKSGASVGDDESKPLKFGPFSIPWQAAGPHTALMYYESSPGTVPSKSELGICVTTEKDIEKIDATDGKWLYKAFAAGKGRPF